MITRLQVENFKALKSATVPLGSFTVLIGPNDTGKSTILQALNTLSRVSNRRVHDDAPDGGVFMPDLESVLYRRDSSRVLSLGAQGEAPAAAGRYVPYSYAAQFKWEGNRGRAIREEAGWDDGKIRLVTRDGGESIAQDMTTTQTLRDDHWQGDETFLHKTSRSTNYPVWQGLAHELSSVLVRFNPSRLTEPSRLPVGGAPSLEGDGYGLAAVIDHLATGPNPDLRVALESDLHRLVPTLRGVALSNAFVQGGSREPGKALEFRLTPTADSRGAVTIPARHTSDGAVLATGYLALAYGTTARRLLIDEPENGLHPHALKFVVDLLRRISRGDIGPEPRQIVMTTHSPILLNFVEPEEVLVVTRSNGAVQITPMTETKDFASRYQDYDLGELWYNVGETELVEGT